MTFRAIMILAIGAGLLVARWAPAQEKTQEKIPGPKEEAPKPKPEVKETPPEARPLAAEPECESCRQGIKVLWVEKEVPVQRLAPREVVTMEKRKTLVVAYRDEKKVVCDIVLKPRQVEKLVKCTVLKEEKTCDPHTGQCCVVMKPCEEVQVVKDTVYEAVREERTITVKVPYLKETEIEVPRKDLLIEYKTVMKKEGYPVALPYDVPKPKAVVVPLPCPDAGCHQ